MLLKEWIAISKIAITAKLIMMDKMMDKMMEKMMDEMMEENLAVSGRSRPFPRMLESSCRPKPRK